MIELTLPALADAPQPYVTRLRVNRMNGAAEDAVLWADDNDGATFIGTHGVLAVDGVPAIELDGDVVLVQPGSQRVDRLLRSGSPNNTVLITERCDQLCVMCSQPPKKTHIDQFDLLEQACLLAEPGIVIGLSGGEPTLYKEQLLGMVERVLAARSDLEFHILSNAQHFEQTDITRLRDPLFRRVLWGIPLYANDRALHDRIVGKAGAFDRLEESFAHLTLSGARVELRTVLVEPNMRALPSLAQYIAARLRFIDVWSIMQLENIGFARNRWAELYVNHSLDFEPIGAALVCAQLHGVPARLFNFPRCTVPEPFRHLAAASISDWKRKYVAACASCTAQRECTGFFEWHPAEAIEGVHPL